MGKKLVSNANILEMFRSIEDIQADESLDESQQKVRIKNVQDGIVIKLSFLVYGQARQYRSFPNYEDLVQEGFIGLVKAVQKFNWVEYPNFFAYAEQWIRHSVKRAASKFDVVYNPNKTRVIYSDPDENEIDVSEDPEGDLYSSEKRTNIDKILSDFPERDRQIVNKIFGLNGNEPETLREIGPQFGLTHERIRQIKNSVLDKLKRHQGMIEMS